MIGNVGRSDSGAVQALDQVSMKWWQRWKKQPPATPMANDQEITSAQHEVGPEQFTERNFPAAVLTSCTAMAGVLWFPALRIVSVAGMLYISVPAAQQAYDDVTEERRVTPALLETLAMAGVLALHMPLLGSVGFSLYYLGRKAFFLNQKRRQWREAWKAPETARILRAGVEMEVAVTQLEPGDRIVVRTGEMVPVGGMVVEGTAWVDRRPLVIAPETCVLKAGCTVEPANIVLVGHIGVEQPAKSDDVADSSFLPKFLRFPRP